MRKIPNRKMENKHEDYFSVFSLMLEAPRNGQSTSYEEMLIAAPLSRRFRNASCVSDTGVGPEVGKEFLMLEEAEWKELCDRLRAPNAGFLRNTEGVLDMLKAVLEAPKVDLDTETKPVDPLANDLRAVQSR